LAQVNAKSIGQTLAPRPASLQHRRQKDKMAGKRFREDAEISYRCRFAHAGSSLSGVGFNDLRGKNGKKIRAVVAGPVGLLPSRAAGLVGLRR
jgi:hypothetical protein